MTSIEAIMKRNTWVHHKQLFLPEDIYWRPNQERECEPVCAEKAYRSGEGSYRWESCGQCGFGGSRSPPQSPDMDEDVMMIQTCIGKPIYFTNKDQEDIDPDHNEALVVTLNVVDNVVMRILIDKNDLCNLSLKDNLSL